MRAVEDGQATRAAAAPRSTWRAVAVPTEHGGWSLTAEPVLLGLLVAFSGAGLALGVAAFLAFMARTPLKVMLVDRHRERWLERSRVASRVVAVELVAIAVLVTVAAATAERPFWLPIALAAPLVLVELWFDMRSRSRRLLPEVAGVIGMSAAVAVIALAGGTSTALAFGLWCAVGARAAATIPSVRTQVFRAKGQPDRRWVSDVAQIAAAVAVLVAWGLDALPAAAALAVVVIAAVNLAVVRTPPRPAVVVGIQQTITGLVVVGVTAAAVAKTGMT